jgi:hypothetical protein
VNPLHATLGQMLASTRSTNHGPMSWQALKLSSEIPEDEAMDMQGWPDSFM